MEKLEAMMELWVCAAATQRSEELQDARLILNHRGAVIHRPAPQKLKGSDKHALLMEGAVRDTSVKMSSSSGSVRPLEVINKHTVMKAKFHLESSERKQR